MQRHNVYRNNLRTFKRQMKFRLTIILYLLCGLTQPASALEQVKGFFQIRNGEDLVAFARLVNSGKTNIKAVLVSDINYCEYDEMIGSQSELPFCGVFEGACHKITFDMESDSIGVSLFRFISHSGVVRNLYVKGNIRSHNKVAGGLVAFLRGGTISNCLCKVNISSDYTGTCSYGGIVGTSSGNSSIVKSVFDGRISAPYGDGIGGLVGWADSSGTTIRDCHVSCDFELRTLNNSNSVARAFLPNDVTTWGVYYLNELGAASDGAIRITQEQWQIDDILYNFYSFFFNHEEQEHEIDSEYYQNLLAYLGLLFVFTAMTAAVLIMTLLYYKAHHVAGADQAGPHPVEAGISGIDVLFLDLHLIVFPAPGTMVGLLPWLRLRRSLPVIGIRSGGTGSGNRQSLSLRPVLLYLRQSLDDIVLLLLLCILLDEQFFQR